MDSSSPKIWPLALPAVTSFPMPLLNPQASVLWGLFQFLECPRFFPASESLPILFCLDGMPFLRYFIVTLRPGYFLALVTAYLIWTEGEKLGGWGYKGQAQLGFAHKEFALDTCSISSNLIPPRKEEIILHPGVYWGTRMRNLRWQELSESWPLQSVVCVLSCSREQRQEVGRS